MTELPRSDGDERIFTLFDVRSLFKRLKKSLFRACLVGGGISLAFAWLKTPNYKAEASFKEAAEKSGGESLIKDFLGGAGFSANQPQAIVLMKSNQVLKPLVERLGLSASVARGGLVSKLYRRLRDNWLAERGCALPELDWFEFQNVFYEGEAPLHLSIRFQDASCFSVIEEGSKSAIKGIVGAPLKTLHASFTLSRTPKNLKRNKDYQLKIGPWLDAARGLKKKLHIASGKVNKSIYDLSFLHRDRHLGARVLNELMNEYRMYLKKDHDQIASEQLVYLEAKQDQIYQKLGAVFDDHAAYLSQSLQENGFLGLEEQARTVLSPLQSMLTKLVSIDVEQARLADLEKEGRFVPPSDDGPFSSRLLEIARTISDLKQQRDLLELSLDQHQHLSGHLLALRQEELRAVRERRDASKELLSAYETGKSIPKLAGFAPEQALAAWAGRLSETLGEDREDFADYLDNHIRLLSVQEKMLQERFFYGDTAKKEFDGIDLATARQLFVEYNNKLDAAEASMRHFEQLKAEIEQKSFSLSSLSAVLRDPLSQSLIASANQMGMLLKDEKHHTIKEGERWNEELSLQKKILKDHLEQLYKVEELNAGLIKEKIVGLQQTSLDCIHRQISVLSEQASDAIRERKLALMQEKKVLESQVAALREKASQGMPERWRHEQWLKYKTELGVKMMETFTELVESKTIGHHLHHVESKPLDFAIAPRIPLKPGLFSVAFLGAFAASFGLFFLRLIQTILKGFPTSIEKLKAMRYPVLGKVSSFCDGPIEPKGDDLELLRQAALFLESGFRAKTVALLTGKGPDYSYAFAENLARRSLKTIVVRCDFHSKFKKEDTPGLLQLFKGEITELPIRKKGGFDILMPGGYTPYGLEAVQSAPFQSLLETLKKKYDYVFLLIRSPLYSSESIASLCLADKAIATVTNEPTEELTPLFNWAYHENIQRLTFIVKTPV